MNRILFVLTTFTILLALACARQTTPTGGPQDTIPPYLLSVEPKNRSVHFQGNQIEMYFDEYVQLNNPREQLLITPTISPDHYELTAQKRKVTLQLKTKLDSNTTYTFNFRESIRDITEKNPADRLLLAYSTGNYIDSLQIQGLTTQALTGVAVKDATIALIQPNDTFNIFKHKPTYISQSDKTGTFNFQNLPPGDYLIYAFNDKNKNLIVDSRSEGFGYTHHPLTLSPDSIPDLHIPLISLDTRPIVVISARPYNTYFNIRFNKAFDIASIHDSTNRLIAVSSTDHTNIRLYSKAALSDSIPFRLTAIDSLHNIIDTTLYALFNPQAPKPESFAVSKEESFYTLTPSILTFRLVTNKPVSHINTDSIYVQLDSVTRYNASASQLKFDSLYSTLTFTIPIRQQINPETTTPQKPPQQSNSPTPHKLTVSKGSILSIEGDSSNRIQETLQLLTPTNTGTLLVVVESQSQQHYIVQVLDSKTKVIRQTIDTKESTFNYLSPGTYRIRVISDYNQNSRWDPGNYFEQIPPETTTFYRNEQQQTEVTLKANWEIGPLLITLP